MNYLVSNNVFTFNNGPEFSAFERLAAFNRHGIPTKLVLKDYSSTLSMNLASHYIDPHSVINMYDYFQGTVDEDNRPLNVHYLPSFPFETYHLKGIDNNKAKFDYYGNRKGTINFMPSQVTKVGSIDYFDRLGHVVVTEHWDSRGFPSRLDSYHLDGSVGTSRFLRRDGSTALVVTHMNIQGQVRSTMWKLLDYHGRNWMFDNEDALFGFFLNELNRQQKGNFISDRRIMDQFVMSVQNPLSRIAVVHDIPVQNPRHAVKSALRPLQETLFDPHQQFPVHFDQIVFPTDEERQTFADRFAGNLPDTKFVTAVDSCVKVTVQEHQKQQILPIIAYRGMLGSTKKTGDLVRAFNTMAKHSPALRLKLQGYFENQDEEKKLKDLVKQLALESKVSFKPYAPFDEDFFKDVSLFVNPTDSEAFGMNLLEAMAAGVPVVAYNVPFLADNLVRDGQNGVLVKARNPHSLAEAAMALLNDDEKYQQLSQGALQTAQGYNESHLVEEWRNVLQHVY